MLELKDTVELMNSEDYKDRFKAEYLQAKIRRDKLHNMIIKYHAGTLDFQPKCPVEVLMRQKVYMDEYIDTLLIRAELEEINLQSPPSFCLRDI